MGVGPSWLRLNVFGHRTLRTLPLVKKADLVSRVVVRFTRADLSMPMCQYEPLDRRELVV